MSDSWVRNTTSSGSGAENAPWQESPWEEYNSQSETSWLIGDWEPIEDVGDEHTYAQADEAFLNKMDGDQTYGTMELPKGFIMTTKIPPILDSTLSWFVYEDLVADWDWEDLCQLEPEKRGPALKAQMRGKANIFKKELDREKLRDPENGINYFMKTLRKHYLKGATNIFMYRPMQFLLK